MTKREPELFILDSNLEVDGDFTVSGTIYMVKTIADLQKIEGIDTITIPPVSTDSAMINTASSINIDGDFIICDELNYNLCINGTTTTMNSVTI